LCATLSSEADFATLHSHVAGGTARGRKQIATLRAGMGRKLRVP